MIKTKQTFSLPCIKSYYTTLRLSSEPNDPNEIFNFLVSPLPLSLPTKPTSPIKIKSLTSKLKNKKSSSYDLMTNSTLKLFLNKSVIRIIHLHKAMLRLSSFHKSKSFLEYFFYFIFH